MLTFPFSLFNDEGFKTINSLTLNGVDEYIGDFGIGGELDGLSGYSASFWIKPTSASRPTAHALIDILTAAPSNYKFRIKYANTTAFNLMILVNTGTSFAIWNSTSVVIPNQWNHVVCSADLSTNTFIFVINGVDSAVTNVFGTITEPFGVSGTASDDSFFKSVEGQYDELSLYDRNLTVLEAQELYNNGKPLDVRQASTSDNLTHFYRLGEKVTIPSVGNLRSPNIVGSTDNIVFNTTIASNVTEDVPEWQNL